MKKLILVVFALTSIFLIASAQIENPVEWSYSAKKIGNKQYEVHLTATIEGKWHFYAQDAGEGPEPTSFIFNKNPLIKLIGKVNEIGKLETSFDKNFNSTLKYYNKYHPITNLYYFSYQLHYKLHHLHIFFYLSLLQPYQYHLVKALLNVSLLSQVGI